MTKKDYIAIAAALADAKPMKRGLAHVQWLADLAAITRVLQDDNPDFDVRRFEDAAGLNG